MNCRGLLLSVSVLLLALVAHADAPRPMATLRTLDGRVLTGRVSCSSAGYLLVNPVNAPPATVPPGNLLSVTLSPIQPPERELDLIDGTVLTTQFAITAKGIRVLFPGSEVTYLPMTSAARLIFHPMTPQQLAAIPAGKTGVVLINGDFYEGQVSGLAPGARIDVQNLIFGDRTFRGGELSAVIMADIAPKLNKPWIIRTTDGAVAPVDDFKIGDKKIETIGGVVSPLWLSQDALASIECGGDRLTPLDSIAGATTAPAGDPSEWADASNVTLMGAAVEHVVVVPGGGARSYSLEGNERLLLCEVGVPRAITPTVAVSMTVALDGKVVYRSPMMCSIDNPIPVTIKLAGVKKLTLSANSNQDAALGAWGAFADATIVK